VDVRLAGDFDIVHAEAAVSVPLYRFVEGTVRACGWMGVGARLGAAADEGCMWHLGAVACVAVACVAVAGVVAASTDVLHQQQD